MTGEDAVPPSAWLTERGPSPPGVGWKVAAALTFVVLGLRVAFAGPGDVLILGWVAALWATLAAARFGLRAVVGACMVSVAVTVPMNGVRAGAGLALSDVPLAIAAVALLAESVTRRGHHDERRHPLPSAAYRVGVAIVVLGGALGTFFSLDPLPSLAKLARFALSATVPVIVFRGWRPNVATLRRYAWCWVAGAVASGLVALASRGDVSGRSAGLTTHPNHLAMISTLGAGLALALCVGEVGWRRWAAAACSGVLALTVMRAGSRAGLLALVVAGAVVAMRARPVSRPTGRPGKGGLLICALGLVAVALLAGNAVQLGQHNALRRVLGDTTSASSDQARVSLLHAGLHTISEHPLTGTGFENVLEAHNVYVQTWAAGGVLGIVGFLVLAVAVVRGGLSVPARSPEGWLATGFVAGYLGYLAAGTVQNFLWDRYLWLHVAAILWLAAGARRTEAPVQPCA